MEFVGSKGQTVEPLSHIARKGARMMVYANVEYEDGCPPDVIVIRGERYVRDKRKELINQTNVL